MYKKLGIAIVSRNEIEREGLRRILTEQAFDVLGVYRDHHELDLTEAVDKPGIIPMVIVDTAMEEEGLATCHHVHARWPNCKIVVFAADCQSQRVVEAFQAGIDGYVGKQTSCASLAEMLKLVALGEKMIPSQVIFDLTVLRSGANCGDDGVSIDEANLSEREIEILHGLIRGEPNKVISRRLAITEATVKVHVKSILRKAGVMNRTQAAIWGMSRGLATMAMAGAARLSAAGGAMLSGAVTSQLQQVHLS